MKFKEIVNKFKYQKHIQKIFKNILTFAFGEGLELCYHRLEENNMYTIKEVAKLLGLNANAIRFYEKKELIKPQRHENNYRAYSIEDIGRLQTIMLYRKMGFSIESIEEILNETNLLEVFTAQYRLLNEHIHAMTHIRETMSHCVETMINETSINESVLNEMSKTADWIVASNQWKDKWHFDNWANRYDEEIRVYTGGLDFYAHYDQVLNKVCEHTHDYLGHSNKSSHKEKGVVVEIGIGTGNLARRIIDSCQNDTQYIGVDQSLNMLKLAKSKCPESEVRMGTFLQLPLNQQTADVIVTSYAFHHCNDVERRLAIQEMNRILKRQGRIVISDLMFKDQASREAFENTCTSEEKYELEDEFFANVDEVVSIFNDFGFSVEIEQIDALIWNVIATK